MTSPHRHAQTPLVSAALQRVQRVLTGTDPALIVPTSGSTTTPKIVSLSGSALLASGQATEERLGGPGQWLLALPVDHIAGLQVLARSVIASRGREPALTVMDLNSGFHPEPFLTAIQGMTGQRRYVSLVPTQLRRLLTEGSPDLRQRTRTALQSFDAILLGGAAADPQLLTQARSAGLNVVTTYGMSETCGGCVYDGIPLAGMDVTLDKDSRVLLRGRMVMSGYVTATGEPDGEATAVVMTSTGWLKTNDLGKIHNGKLAILGRLDDVIISGGVNIAPQTVEAAVQAWLTRGDNVETVLESSAICISGVPDAEWGHRVVLVVEGDSVTHRALNAALPELRRYLTNTLGPASAPRNVVVVGQIPTRGPGKIDRRTTSRIAAQLLAASGS